MSRAEEEDDAYRFDTAGPKRKCFSWDVPEDKRAILACLVAGVYALEYDRVKKHKDEQRLAHPWWISFNYDLVDSILGNDGLRINGAVFVWSSHASCCRPPQAPMVVLAFRGTTSLTSDYIVDLKLARQELHKTARFTAAYTSVRNAVHWHGAQNVCVTGHSLGAALALSAARLLALEGQFLEAHLFNPPFSSPTAPLKSVLGSSAYAELLEAYTLFKAGAVKLLRDEQQRRESELRFLALASWYPNLYVHRKDPVCSGFIEHFFNYSYMLAGRHGKLVMPHESIRGVLFSSSTQPHHLIPSASLHVVVESETQVTAFQAHSLTQWWSPELKVERQDVNLTGHEHAHDRILISC